MISMIVNVIELFYFCRYC